MKKIFFATLMLTFMVILVGCGADNNERRTIIMGTSADFPPFEFIAEGGQGRHGQYDGIDVAIAVRLAEHIDADLIIHDADFGGLIMDLNGGSIDFIAAGMTIRPDRAEQVSFSIPYFTAMQYCNTGWKHCYNICKRFKRRVSRSSNRYYRRFFL
jgi:polar amino acid transport system substrate-binding protein